MSSRAVRSLINALPYDDFDSSAKLVNFGAIHDTGKFNSIPENVDNDSLRYLHNTYLTDGQYNINVSFGGVFSISFWAKFPATSLGESDLSDIRFILVLNNGQKLEHTISSSDNNWHHYSIVRESNGMTTMRIDGLTVGTPTVTSAALNLTDNSYIYLGQSEYRYYDGYEVITDDVCIVDGVLWTQDFTTELPDDYLDLSKFKHYLYVVVSTGEVYGYAE